MTSTTSPGRLVPVLAAAFALAVMSCRRPTGDAANTLASPPAAPAAPAAQLRPLVPELKQLAAKAPRPLAPERLDDLVGLVEAAFAPGSEPRLATHAKRALLEDEDAVRALEQGLQHRNPDIRAACAYELGLKADPASETVLLLRLKEDAYVPVVAIWIAGALARLRNHSGLPVLIERMRDPATQEIAGQRAIEILRTAGRDPGEAPTWESLEQGLQELHTHWREHGCAAPELPEGEPPAMNPALEGRVAQLLLDLDGFQLRPVDNTRFIVPRLGRKALPLLRRALAASEDLVRTHSLEIVTTLGAPARSLADRVLPLVRDPVSALSAVQALGAIHAPEALPELLRLLDGSDLELRAAAAAALGPLDDPQAIPPLRARLRDEHAPADERVRAAASLAMLERGGEGLEFLRARLAAKDYHEATLLELIDRVQH